MHLPCVALFKYDLSIYKIQTFVDKYVTVFFGINGQKTKFLKSLHHICGVFAIFSLSQYEGFVYSVLTGESCDSKNYKSGYEKCFFMRFLLI